MSWRLQKKNLGTSQSIRKRQRVPVTLTEGREVPYGTIVIWPLGPSNGIHFGHSRKAARSRITMIRPLGLSNGVHFGQFSNLSR
jgi:hypothetical protein